MGSHSIRPAATPAPSPLPPPSPSAETAAILDSLRRLVRALRIAASAAEKELGLSSAQLFALQRLGESPAASVAELAARTLTDQSSVSVVVSRLVEAGLVQRRRSRVDRRRAELSVTAAGRATLRRAPEAAQARIVAALEATPPPHRRALDRALAALLRDARLDAAAPALFFEDDAPARRGRRSVRRG